MAAQGHCQAEDEDSAQAGLHGPACQPTIGVATGTKASSAGCGSGACETIPQSSVGGRGTHCYPFSMADFDRFSRQDFTESRTRGSWSKCKAPLSQPSQQLSQLSQPSQSARAIRAASRPSQSSLQVRPSCSCHAAAK